LSTSNNYALGTEVIGVERLPIFFSSFGRATKPCIDVLRFSLSFLPFDGGHTGSIITRQFTSTNWAFRSS